MNSYFRIDFTTVVVLASALSVLLLQLWLCFNVKRIFIKLLPIILLVLSTVAFSVCSAIVNGWDGLGYLFFALLSFGLIFMCGIAWGVWAVAKKRSK